MVIKPKVLNPAAIFGLVIAGFSFLVLINSFIDTTGGVDNEFIILFSVIFIGSLLISFVSRLFIKLYIEGEYVIYSSIFKSTKIKISEIKKIQINSVRGTVVKGIVIVSAKFKKEGLLDVNSNYGVNIEIQPDFDNKELADFLKLILNRNDKIETDDHVDTLMVGGDVQKSYMENLLSHPSSLLMYVLGILGLLLVYFSN